MPLFLPRFRRAFLLLILALACAGVAASAGRLLYAQDALGRADVIYVLGGARADRWLEGADLYQSGYAPRILLSSGGGDTAEEILRTRGIRLTTDADLARDGLMQVGVPDAAILLPPRRSDNTAAEAALFAELAAQHGWRAVIVVTSKYHTRRAGIAMRRALKSTSTRVIVRASRYDSFRPGIWWTHRYSSRMVLFELPKLVFYVCGMAE